MVYKKVNLDITQAQLRKAASGKQIQLTRAQVGGSTHTVHLHPANYEKFMKAQRNGTGVRMHIAKGEIEHDLDQMQGGSVFSWLKGAAKSVGKFAKNNWDLIKPIASKLADAAVPAIATAFGQPGLAIAARSGLKELTGVGFKTGKLTKGSEAAKAHMAALRMRKGKAGGSMRAGSFRL